MNAKRITREGNGGFVVVRMTESEARDLESSWEALRGITALKKLRAALKNINGDEIREEESR